MGSQLAEKRQFGHLALDGARALARSTLPEPLEGRPAVRGLGLEHQRFVCTRLSNPHMT